MKSEVVLFKALSDETRFAIVNTLLDSEKCVCEIVPKVKRTQSTVSIQLGKLEGWGILKSRREGRWMYYSINDARIRALIKAIR